MPEPPPRRCDRVVHTPGPPARYINAEPRPVRWRTSGEYVFATTPIAGRCVYRIRGVPAATILSDYQLALERIMVEPRGGQNYGRTLRNKSREDDDGEAGEPSWRSNNFEDWIKGDYIWQNEEWHRETYGYDPRGKVWWKQATGQPSGRPPLPPLTRKITDLEGTISLNGYEFKPTEIVALLGSGPLSDEQRKRRLELGCLFRELAKQQIPYTHIAQYFGTSRTTVWRLIADANRARRVEVKHKP
jgi:hypothetical protein